MSKYILIAALAAGLAAPAQAATLSLITDGVVSEGNKTLKAGQGGGGFSLDDPSRIDVYAPLTAGSGVVDGGQVTELSGAEKTGANGLFLSGPADLTFTYLGHEAGFVNQFLFADELLFQNHTAFGQSGSTIGDSVTRTVAGGGFLDFAFTTNGGGGAPGVLANDGEVTGRDVNIAYSALFNADTSVIVLFGDGTGNSDNDDLAVRIDVAGLTSPDGAAVVPLPAAAWMLLAGLGGLAAVARSKKA